MQHTAQPVYNGQLSLMYVGCYAAGAEDPWEKVEWGRKLQHYPTVEEFKTFVGK